LLCDEADRYIPQRILFKDPNASLCLGAGEDIAKRGRKHGIFPVFISQRNADLNKSVTELCDTAIVFWSLFDRRRAGNKAEPAGV
jgi:DNA helicase HerA-like ATPase